MAHFSKNLLTKRLAPAVLAFCLVVIALAWAFPGASSAQTLTPTSTAQAATAVRPTSTAQAAPAVLPTPTLNPIPELNPNPQQTDGVILGAAAILAVIAAGVWTYGRKRKD